MTKYFLAIPGVAFLFTLFLSPPLAQTPPETAPSQAANASTQSTQSAPLSTEDLAKLYLVRKEYKEAEDLFRKLTAQQPTNAVYWNELGISLHNQTQLAAAIKCYQKSAALNAHYADPINNIGTVWYERKKYAKAIRAYKRAIGIKEEYAPFYLNLGYAYFGEKKYEDSIAAFRKGLEYDPDAFDVSKAHSGTVIQDRSLSADRGLFYFLLAKSFAQAGNVDRCLIYLRKSRDEGYKDLLTAKSDPAFAGVLKNPEIQEVLEPKPPENVQP
jgi:tetratricopeptide (TPR) repeat protein